MLLVLPLAAGCGSTGGGSSADSAITPKSGPPAPPTSAPVSTRAIATKQDPSVEAVVNNVNVTLNPGWNGVGFQAQQLTALTPGPGVAGLAFFNGTGYTTGNFDTATINAGTDKARRGFWVFNNGAGQTSFSYSGNDDGQGNFVNLQPGYNLVSFCVANNVPGSQITASVNGSTVPIGSVILPQITEIQADNSYVGVDLQAGGSVKPGRPYWIFSNAVARLNLPGGSSGLIVNPSGNVSTVVGAQINFTGTFNGAPTNLTIQSGNSGVAVVNGSTLQGVSVGTTNYTASANGTTVSGNITVQNGSLTGSLILNPGTALTLNEGDQRQFSAFAQFATAGNGTIQADVTNQVVWVVTPDGGNQNRGEVISLDAGAGLFTATRGNGGQLSVGAIYSTTSAVATANTTVTVNKTNPTIQVRPVGSNETTNSRIPGGGWSRLYEAIAVYPSGFQKEITGTDVSWQFSPNTAVAALNNFSSTAGSTGKAELVTSSVPQIAQTTLTATYTNSASGFQAGNHTVGVISYVLQSTAVGFTPTLPNDKLVIPGPNYVRPITVTATFQDRNSAGNNLVMPLFVNPTTSNIAGRAGRISLYLNPGVTTPPNFASEIPRTNNNVQLLTSAISAVGYTHLLRNVTTGIYNQNVLNVRVNYHPTTTAGSAYGQLSAGLGSQPEVVGSSSALGGDRDLARTATLSGMTLDGATGFSVSVQNANLRRGTGTNATLNAQYVGVGGQTEDVTQLAEWSSSAANIRVGNTNNNIGERKARVLNQAQNNGMQDNALVRARYPKFTGGFSGTTQVNITLP